MNRFSKLAAGAAAILLLSAGFALAKDPGKLGGKPNLNGVWEVMNTANWSLEPHDAAAAPAAQDRLGAIGAIPAGRGVIEGGGTIPYLADAAKQRDDNRKGAPMEDPEAKCYLPGIPRASYMGHPFQIVQGDDGDLLMAYEYASANRTIHMQKVDVPPIDTWMGTSYGAWEGNTLKVVTLGQNGMTWLDRAGDYLTPTATVIEHFTLIDHDHIAYEVSIEDPAVYAKPWKIAMTLYRHVEPNAELLDFRCVPFSEVLIYGDLLPKDQKPQ
jgi:hypothetical protein